MGIAAPLQVMQSRGGITSAEMVMDRPVSLLLSGLAAGVIGSKHAAAQAGHDNVISLDMGGTSCDIALVRAGVPIVTNQTRIAHYPLRMQMVDVNTIGAGGGSIAWIDAAGGLRVGPHSAGADPGPACYRRGGDQPTVTDASLVLGYLNPQTFAGGIALDLDAAEAAIGRLAQRIGLDTVATAAGIHRIVNARMTDEVRRVTVQRGFDPRQFSLLPLGGAGPVHGAAIALALGMASVLVPDAPGVLSAFGLLVADVEHDQMVTFAAASDRVDRDAFDEAFAQLTALGARKMAADGIAPELTEIRRQADMRYRGQSYELTIDVPDHDPIGSAVAAFHRRHQDFYGHANPAAPVEFVNLRTIHVSRAAARHDGAAPPGDGAAARPPGTRRAYFAECRGFVAVPVHARGALAPGAVLAGPAIVEQADTTLVIHPGQRATVRADRSLLLEVAHDS
jgi:N-methylhydantoinase A